MESLKQLWQQISILHRENALLNQRLEELKADNTYLENLYTKSCHERDNLKTENTRLLLDRPHLNDCKSLDAIKRIMSLDLKRVQELTIENEQLKKLNEDLIRKLKNVADLVNRS
jgi:hypothetical protein